MTRVIALALVALVALQRLAELVLARRNGSRLEAAGWVEVGSGHYPVIVGAHAAWLIACAWAAWATPVIRWEFVILFLLLEVGRAWVILSLGRFWTTRVYTRDDAPLVRGGPYRFLRHPNYLIVVLEVLTLPLAFGAWRVALAFSILNAGVLAVRIRVENRALSDRRGSVEA